MEKQLLILFGPTGAGKNYVAQIIEAEWGYDFYDADQDLTGEMIAAIRRNRLFTDRMRAAYFRKVAARIEQLLAEHDRVVITQGLFKNENRRALRQKFPFAEFILVTADDTLILERIRRRNNLVTPAYAQKINSGFEKPDFECATIINNAGSEAILKQICAILYRKN